MRHRIACALLFVAALQCLAIAQTPRWSSAELASHSDVILTGRVADITAGRDGNAYVTLDVDEVLKGWVPERQIILKQREEAAFTTGEAVLVFLSIQLDRTLSTTAGWRGKWILATDTSTGGRIARRPTLG